MTSRFARILWLVFLVPAIQLVSITCLAAGDEYPFSLKFDPIGDGVELKPLLFTYEVEKTAKRRVDFGAFAVDDQSFFVSLKEMRSLHPVFAAQDLRQKEKELTLFVRWPGNLFEDAQIEMINRAGSVLWREKVTLKQQGAWSELKAQWQRTIKDSFKGGFPVFETQWGFRHFERLRQRWMGMTEQVRFCVSSSSGQEFERTRLCTAYQELMANKGQFHVLPLISAPAPVRVIINGKEPQPENLLQDRVPVELARPFTFFLGLASGTTIEFSTLPEGLKNPEIYRDLNQKVVLVGEGDTPLQAYEWVQKESVSPLVDFFGWQQTIGNLPSRWKTEMNEKKPLVYIRGKGGGVFLQEFEITKLPSEDFRPYLHAKNRDATYINGPLLRLKKPLQTDVTSSENEILSIKGEEDVLWDFRAKNRGELNRSYVDIQAGKQTFRAYHEMYKGYPRELSARLSTILQTNGKILVMSEGAFNYWYEDVFGWQNRLLSVQRWGTSFKYFRSLIPVETSRRHNITRSMMSTSAAYEAFTADLKYRFSPGLWGRDETWGLMVGAQKMSYDVFGSSLLGAGFFWARSMPKVFDDIFNIVPILRYPKWVDMDFIYYAGSLDPKVAPANLGGVGFGTWSLNFHGKVLWTDSFFGEAGFGIRQSDFVQKFTELDGPRSATLNFKLTLFYSTIGIGFNF